MTYFPLSFPLSLPLTSYPYRYPIPLPYLLMELCATLRRCWRITIISSVFFPFHFWPLPWNVYLLPWRCILVRPIIRVEFERSERTAGKRRSKECIQTANKNRYSEYRVHRSILGGRVNNTSGMVGKRVRTSGIRKIVISLRWISLYTDTME